VVTLNGWTLPWRMNDGVKEFHLVAEPVVREVSPGFKVNMWGYNGQSPGPTIEVVEGDRVRIFVTNKLPEHTTIHWHGQRLPSGMDGVGGLNQRAIPVGKTFVYEFEARRPGTFMYHPHADEMVQMAMGMMGMWVTHPKAKHPHISEVDRDFCFLLNAFDIEPGSKTPKVNTMTGLQHLVLEQPGVPGHRHAERAPERPGAHPGGQPHHDQPPDPPARARVSGHRHRRRPDPTQHALVRGHHRCGRGPDAPDRADRRRRGRLGHALPQEPPHHERHGARRAHHDRRGPPRLVKKIQKVAPDYMLMGERGMADMGEMQMPMPDNTAPMMTGTGQFGPLEMGGMFTVFKVRKDQKPGDYKDPGPYKFPEGTVAYEWNGLMKKFPNMEHDEPYMAHVEPGKQGTIVWHFNRAGEFDFACLLHGHYQAGMVGKIKVAAL
jgi:plastocyanin